jgi:glycosyltransferase involved in cell wall biosynthesis
VNGRRFLFVTDSLQVGGAERVLVGLAAALRARGASVTIAASMAGALEAEARAAGVEVRILTQRLVKRRVDQGFAQAVERLVERVQPDVVHGHMYASTIASSHAVRRHRVPLVVHEHSEAAWRDRRARLAAASAYQRSAAIIAVSEAIRRRLLYVDRVPPGKIDVVPNTLPPLPHRPLEHRLPKCDGPVVGVVARLQPAKGVDVFLRAAARLLHTVPPPINFVVVGDGPQRHELERLAARLGVAATFLGFRADGPAVIGELDLLVVPSFSEGTPLVVLEGCAAAVPIVATSVGGIPEQLRHGTDALLVRPGDDIAIAAACRRVLLNQPLATRLATTARSRVDGVAKPNCAVDTVERIYERVLRGIEAEEYDGRGAA